MRLTVYTLLVLILLSLSSCVRFFFFSDSQPTSNLQKAEILSREGDYSGAIDAYRAHIQDRLAVKNRPDWENPWFYLILIGDIQLGQDDALSAQKTYEEAEEKGVDIYLVSDRIRSVGKYYENKGQFKSAIEILSRHRAKDPLLFDSTLDRLSKELVRQEDQFAGQHPRKSGP